MPGDDVVRRRRNNDAGRDQLPLDLLWGPIPEAQEPDHEPVRSDGRAPLAPLAPEQGRGDGRPQQLLLESGEEVAAQIEELTADLAGGDPPGETFMEKVGRLNMARLRAEEMVLPETVLLPPEPGVEDDDSEPATSAR